MQWKKAREQFKDRPHLQKLVEQTGVNFSDPKDGRSRDQKLKSWVKNQVVGIADRPWGPTTLDVVEYSLTTTLRTQGRTTTTSQEVKVYIFGYSPDTPKQIDCFGTPGFAAEKSSARASLKFLVEALESKVLIESVVVMTVESGREVTELYEIYTPPSPDPAVILAG